MEKWYQLGGNTSVFWDPSQPTDDQQKLLIGEAKQLKRTDRVTAWVRKGGLIELSDADAKIVLEKNEELKNKAKNAAKADKRLESAAQKEQEAKETLRQADLKLKEVETIQAENTQLKAEKQQLLKRIEELEAPKK